MSLGWSFTVILASYGGGHYLGQELPIRIRHCTFSSTNAEPVRPYIDGHSNTQMRRA